MVRQHHQLNGRESEQVPGDGEGQESLSCCSPWGQDMTQQLNNNSLVIMKQDHLLMFWKKRLGIEIRCNEGNKDETDGDNLSRQDAQYLKSQTEILVNQKYSNDKIRLFLQHMLWSALYFVHQWIYCGLEHGPHHEAIRLVLITSGHVYIVFKFLT